MPHDESPNLKEITSDLLLPERTAAWANQIVLEQELGLPTGALLAERHSLGRRLGTWFARAFGRGRHPRNDSDEIIKRINSPVHEPPGLQAAASTTRSLPSSRFLQILSLPAVARAVGWWVMGASAATAALYFLRVQPAVEITRDIERKNQQASLALGRAQRQNRELKAAVVGNPGMLGVGPLWLRLAGLRLQGTTPANPGFGSGSGSLIAPAVGADGRVTFQRVGGGTPCEGQAEGNYLIMTCRWPGSAGDEAVIGWIAEDARGLIVYGNRWQIEGSVLRPIAAFAICPDGPTWSDDCRSPMWIDFDDLAPRAVAAAICTGVETDVCRRATAGEWTFPDRASAFPPANKLSELRRIVHLPR